MADVPVEIKPSFFSIVGFFLPGIVLLGSIGPLAIIRYQTFIGNHLGQRPLEALNQLTIFPGAILLVIFVAAAFVLGATLSDVFSVLRSQIIRRMWCNSRKTYLRNVLGEESLRKLIHNHATALESYVYMQTCGLDLHWCAGRVRMLGASGIAWVLTGIAASLLGFRWPTTSGFIVSGLLVFVVAAFRSRRFDEYVISTAAVLLKGGASTPSLKRDAEH
jgi:hypothetical protein